MTISTSHPSFPQPSNPSDKVWRYMTLEQLISILDAKKLYLSRLDTFNDKLEGSIPVINYHLNAAQIRALDIPQENKNKLLQTMSYSTNAMRYTTYASCWHIKHEESFHMWQLYGGANNRNIAIQTTYLKLTQSKADELAGIYIGKITYINYKNEIAKLSGNALSPSMHKHIAFKHEDEVRIIHCPFSFHHANQLQPQSGISIEAMQANNPTCTSFSVDLNMLIENIYINPYAPSWYYDVASSIISKYSDNIPVRWSDLRSDIYF